MGTTGWSACNGAGVVCTGYSPPDAVSWSTSRTSETACQGPRVERPQDQVGDEPEDPQRDPEQQRRQAATVDTGGVEVGGAHVDGGAEHAGDARAALRARQRQRPRSVPQPTGDLGGDAVELP